MSGKIVCCLIIISTSVATAEDGVQLPLRKVVLFNSGLGYFEHENQIEGNAVVALKFDTGDINDLLKSLVVQDTGGGHVQSVSYPPREDDSDQLGRFSMDLSSHPTLGELLHQLRGENVTLDGHETGTIIGVELKPQNADPRAINREVVNLLTDSGLRGVPLDAIGDIALEDEQLEAELRDALRLLVATRRPDKTTVQFTCVGDGKRTVRVGYIREMPIWKTSYRAVLEQHGQALLQGWAIVENTSESDWHEVALTLASGRPVTFEMDLRRPLFVQRQQLAPSVPPSLASRVYSPALGKLDMDAAVARIQPADPSQRSSQVPILGPNTGMNAGFGGGGMGGMGGMGGGMGMGGYAGMGDGGGGAFAAPVPDADDRSPALDAGEGIVAQATASEIGEQFQYEIAHRVTLPGRRAALIPIVNQPVQAEKLSIFSVADDQEHPMLALRLTNTTDLRLAGGPVTVFDEGSYAGDARIEFLRPLEQRLVNYAQDVDLTLRYDLDEVTRSLSDAQIQLGVLRLEFDLERVHHYRIQSKSDSVRSLVLQQPRDPTGWSLEDEDLPAEKTDRVYRFDLAIPAGQTVEFVVTERNTDEEKFHLKSIELKTLAGIARRGDLPEQVSRIVNQIRELRVGIADLEEYLKLQTQLLADVEAEQSRIRSNMRTLQYDSELYRHYVTKMTLQEKNFDRARQVISRTRTKLSEKGRELAKFFPSTGDAKAPSEAFDPFAEGYQSDAESTDPFR
jgi:hypothetical protein